MTVVTFVFKFGVRNFHIPNLKGSIGNNDDSSRDIYKYVIMMYLDVNVILTESVITSCIYTLGW